MRQPAPVPESNPNKRVYARSVGAVIDEANPNEFRRGAIGDGLLAAAVTYGLFRAARAVRR